jgi:CspA family cold shock protein
VNSKGADEEEESVAVMKGKILRFDETRGYGFIAPDSGGEDVFLHANALTGEKHDYQSGVPVEFDVLESDRGLKASTVRILPASPDPGGPPEAGDAAAHNSPIGAIPRASVSDERLEDDGLCDVLSATALRQELVELCLESVPSMTGEQIVQLRRAAVTLARRHGWVED